jgi:hypothetical protein
MNRPRSLLFLGLALTAVLAACGGAASSASPPVASTPQASSAGSATTETQRNEGGQVTVEATWKGPAAGAVFEIKLDTHSVDLDSLDLASAVLRNDRGESLKAQPWTAPKGGHHREGTLTFGGDAAAFFQGAKSIELVFTGIGDVPERTLRWTIGS